MGLQIKVKNFRCLREVDWSPDGVCVLVGPNGSGKTTLFDALNFLRLACNGDVNQAVASSGGVYFRHLDALPQEAVEFVVRHNSFTWTLGISTGGGPFNLSIFESLQNGGKSVFLRQPGHAVGLLKGGAGFEPAEGNTVLKTLSLFPVGQHPSISRQLVSSLRPLLSTLNGFIVCGAYDLQHLRERGSQVSVDLQISPNGANAFSVLRNWRNKRDHRPAYEFVVKQLCNAFPGVSNDIEFEFGGTITSLALINSKRAPAIPVTFAPNGWLAGLLHLMAVAGAAPGSAVMIDEFENSLHPYAVRRLVQAMREWAAKNDLTVVLSGHSSALLDEFKDHPSQVFVMELDQSAGKTLPIRLTDYRDPEWLKHFSLGELYRHDEFGAPANGSLNGSAAVSAS